MLSDFLNPCRMMDRTSQPDGYGGVVYTYQPGASFNAGIATVSSTQAMIAYAKDTKTVYTIVTGELTTLVMGDVIQRMSDGLMLRITSNAADMTTPARARVKFRQCTAERVCIIRKGNAEEVTPA